MSSAETKLRPSRGTKRAQTREKLLDAAAELFETRGIAVVSLDTVAAHAGLTKGAIYGNFASKDELVYAVVNERVERGLIAFDGETPVREQLRRIVREALGPAAANRAHFAFLVEIDLYAQTRAELGGRFMAAARERHARSAANLGRFADELALPPLQFALTVQALVRGLLFQRAAFPQVVTEQVALTALERLLR
jgi:AcrR family transcriptional regulator